MTVQSPIPDFAEARAAMVEGQLRPQCVTDRGVLEAMGEIPREQFVPEQNVDCPLHDCDPCAFFMRTRFGRRS